MSKENLDSKSTGVQGPRREGQPRQLAGLIYTGVTHLWRDLVEHLVEHLMEHPTRSTTEYYCTQLLVR